MSRTTNDLNDVRTLMGPGVMYIPNSVSRLALFLPVLFGLSGRLMLMISCVMVFLVVFILLVLPRLRPLYQEVQQYTAKINNRVWQVVSGMTAIKLYTAEESEREHFRVLNRDYIRRHMAVVRFRGFLWPFLTLVIAVTEILILWIGGRQVIGGAMTIGQLLQFNLMVGLLTFPILSLGWIMSLLQQGLSAMSRINGILDATEEDPRVLEPVGPAAISFRVSDLTFRYSRHSRPAVQGVSFTIEPGQFVGITGTIGSGKSTVIGVLTRTLKPERGMVYIGDLDIADIEPASLWARMGIVSQDPYLFSRSISENIGLGMDEQAGGARVKSAAAMAGLDQDILTFPDAYDQLIGERGVALSGGQKQRTAIARALVTDRPVIVLDDALSSVDAKTEARIVENLTTLRREKTIILVSHRIAPLQNADWILVFDDGRISEQGKHDDLLRTDGLYARLARLQQLQSTVAGGGV